MSVTLTKETSLFKKDVIKDGINAASATANDYIDDISGSNQTGMVLHPASHSANNYMRLDSSEVSIYKGGTKIASYGDIITLYRLVSNSAVKTLEITNSGLYLYGSTTNTSDVSLTLNGLLLSKGGIQAGTPGISGFVYLSTEDYPLKNSSITPPIAGLAVNGYTPTAAQTDGRTVDDAPWRQVIGTKFGVDRDGKLYAADAHIDGNIIARSLTISNGSNTVNAWDAINITGYTIEIETVDVVGSTTQVKLIPHLYHNGIEVVEPELIPSGFLWYENGVYFPSMDSEDGSIIATRPNTYRVVYEFADGDTEGATPIQPIVVGGDTSKYITEIDETGIQIHPETWNEQSNYIQITGNGVNTIHDSTHFSSLDTNGLKIYNGYADKPVASFGSTINLYTPGTTTSVVTIDVNGGHFTGEITANSGYIGTSSGWQITQNTIKKGDIGSGIVLSATNTTYSGSIGGSASNINNWRFTVGNKFGVTADGTLYANAGKIGGCSIESGVLKITDANISGTISASHIDTSTITLASDRITSGSSSAIISGSGLVISQGGYTAASFSGSEINLYANNSLGANINSSGMTIYSNSSNVAFIGTGTGALKGYLRIGNLGTNEFHTQLSNNTLGFYKNNTDRMCSIYAATSYSTDYTLNIETTSGKSMELVVSGPIKSQSSYVSLEGHTHSGYLSTSGGTVTGIVTFNTHINTGSTTANCGTDSHPWHNVYVNTYFASTTAPSSLSQDYAVAWHKTDSNNYVLCRPSSSRKWKKDIEPISNVIADPKKLYDVRVVQFRYKDKDADDPNNSKYNPTALDVGFIAEEVAEAYPLGAVINENGEPDDWNVRRIVPPMLALIQEQHEEIGQLKNDIQILKEQIDSIKLLLTN